MRRGERGRGNVDNRYIYSAVTKDSNFCLFRDKMSPQLVSDGLETANLSWPVFFVLLVANFVWSRGVRNTCWWCHVCTRHTHSLCGRT